MAEYRTLHTKLWQDEWICELEADAKLLFIYLVTNRAASVAGIYKLPFKFIAFETGLSLARVNKLLDEFQKAGKVYHEDGVIWVKRLRSYQTYDGKASEQVEKRIVKDLADIPDGTLKRQYLAFYTNGTTPDIPTGGGLDTPTVPTPETDTKTDTDTKTETDLHAADAAAREPDLVKELAAIFEKAAGIKLPTASTEKGRNQIGVTWWNPLREMVKIANGQAPALLNKAVAKMRGEKLTIAAPGSVLKVFTSLHGEMAAAPAARKEFSPEEKARIQADLRAKRH